MGKNDQPTRREVKRAVKKWAEDIKHSDQTALGISTDDAIAAIKKGKEAGK